MQMIFAKTYDNYELTQAAERDIKNTRRNMKSSVERILLFIMLKVYVIDQIEKNDAKDLCKKDDIYELK